MIVKKYLLVAALLITGSAEANECTLREDGMWIECKKEPFSLTHIRDEKRIAKFFYYDGIWKGECEYQPEKNGKRYPIVKFDTRQEAEEYMMDECETPPDRDVGEVFPD